MGRPILAATAFGLGLASGAACQVPGTLGLACTENMHCDPGQICVDQVCTSGRPMGTGPQMPPLPLPTTGAADDGSTGFGGDVSSDGGGSSTAALGDSTSTGVACGTTSCQDIDVLIVLDTSDSMSQWLVGFANSLAALFELFTDELGQVCTFHVGFVTADAMPSANAASCQFSGALLRRSETCRGSDSLTPWWSEADGTPEEIFGQVQCELIANGTSGSSDERMLDAVLGALDPANNADKACNAGFRRPDANLVLMFISDEDDPTPTDEIDNIAAQFRAWVDPDLVAFISVVGDPSNGDRACAWVPDGDGEGTGARPPVTLNAFLALAMIPFDQQATVDICQPGGYEFSDAFSVFGKTCGG